MQSVNRELIRQQLVDSGRSSSRTSGWKGACCATPGVLCWWDGHNIVIEDEKGLLDIVDPLHVGFDSSRHAAQDAEARRVSSLRRTTARPADVTFAAGNLGENQMLRVSNMMRLICQLRALDQGARLRESVPALSQTRSPSHSQEVAVQDNRARECPLPASLLPSHGRASISQRFNF